MHMYGYRARVFLRSISLCKSKWHNHHLHGSLIHFSQNLTSTAGREFTEFATEPSMQRQVVEALHSGDRKKASDLLSDFGSRSRHSLTADHFVHIFEYCARSPDPLFVMEILRFMELKGVSMNNICSSLMMQALCNGGYLEEAFDIVDYLGGSQRLYPVLPLYNSLLRSCTTMQNIIQASRCLDLMEKKMVGKNEVTYIELLKLAVLQKNLPAAHLIWQEYIKNYSMTIMALDRFIWSFTSISASIEQQIICMGNKKAKSTELAGLNGQKHPLLKKALSWSFDDIIHGCAKQKNHMLARKLMLQMKNLGLQPSRHTYNGIIKVVSHRSFGDAIRVLKKMQQKNLKPYDSTLASLSITCSKALQLDLAEAFLNQISECLYPNPYNALLASCDQLNQLERAIRVFAKMEQKKVLPNIRTCELLFSLFGVVNGHYEDSDALSKVDVAKRINAIQKHMANNGIQHSHLSMNKLMRALGEEGMIKELIQYLHVAENLFIYRNPSLGTHMYNTVLHYLVEAKESDTVIAIFKKMKLCGCHPDSETYNIMIDCCTILKSYRSACLLLSMMIRKGFHPVICTYNAIIEILLEDENFNEALNLLKQVILDGIQPDVLLFNTVLKEACYKGRIDVIEFIVECMRREKVPPDTRTCGYVFSAYVDSGFHNTAIEALQVLSLRMMSEDGNILRENTNFVNEFILSEDVAVVESQILKLFEDSEDELAIGLLNLRWCAIAGFPICKSADQSLWAKRLEGMQL
ncbi:Pentatricopeptide repeat-containing protein [Glycine soja]|uniref:Pentatricopeptide repeat-containing protein n=1 Tax=Glycine soja TaxID=3848 RepID=A0A0B2PTW5_GLYSO|nr:Pentatricopeptide repeat-containing protein [Glycine soja]